jgi:hypothetical protein
MNPSTSIQLARLREHELRVDAARARLVADARRARNDRHPNRLRLRIGRRRWRWRTAVKGVAAQPIPLGDLAGRLAQHGAAALEAELARFVDRARALGASPVLLSILADRDQPDVARQRAWGRMALEIAARQGHTVARAPDLDAA